MMNNTASEQIFVWMRSTEEESLGKISSFEVDDQNAALTCYQSGASLYFRSTQEMADIFISQLTQGI